MRSIIAILLMVAFCSFYIKMQISTLVKSLQIPYEVLPLPITSIEFIEL